MADASPQPGHPTGQKTQSLDSSPTAIPVLRPSRQDVLNIVILGASFAGLGCAHHFFDHTIDKLRILSAIDLKYRLIVVSPSTNLYWNIGAPRALVRPGLLKNDDAFLPIEPGFHRHRHRPFVFIQGSATDLNTDSREVTITLLSLDAQRRAASVCQPNAHLCTTQPQSKLDLPDVQRISYHALILCTGTSANSDLLSLHGPHVNTIMALNSFHERLASARSIVVGGGGPSGVESAGQLATYLNYTSHLPLPRRYRQARDPKRITLVVGGPRCLPNLKEDVGTKAEKLLRRLGVEIRHGVRVKRTSIANALTGSTLVELDDNSSLIADAYLPCTGVRPNSSFVPAALRNEHGYVITNTDTMRVEGAGERVFAVGDVASYSQNYVLDAYAAVPVAMHNLLNDLLKHELHLASPYGGNDDRVSELMDLTYAQTSISSQLCPITRRGGVGLILNQTLPSFMVYLLKGHDYRVCKTHKVINGSNPYAIKNQYE